ncbi:MAG: hypothetical protein ICCCNLDF_00384 [Planctomycetes bacterium]|nr:hypothetical protein [Planctomycetota bacterium]
MLPASLAAHNTLFGDAPRTIWRGGLEVEAETHWEMYRRTVLQDSTLSNPNDTRVQVWSWTFGLTYGITRDISVRAMFPVGYAVRRSKNDDLNDHYLGLKDMRVGFKFRLYNEPRPGGSFQGGLFIDFKLPTAQDRGSAGLLSERISFGDETVDVKVGATWSFSTTRHYFWLDVAARVSTLSDGRVMGPSASIHPAYAVRVFELNDYREFDLILLFEGDAEVAERMWMNRKRVVPSGFYKFHVGGGVQMNITNRIEVKLGYEWPIYQYYFAKTFVHEGEAKISFNYLF